MRLASLALFALLALGSSGCVVRGSLRASVKGPHIHVPKPQAPHVHVHHRGVPWVVVRGHVHDHACGHYQYRNEWYYEQSHVHRDGCGHQLRAGVWVVVE